MLALSFISNLLLSQSSPPITFQTTEHPFPELFQHLADPPAFTPVPSVNPFSTAQLRDLHQKQRGHVPTSHPQQSKSSSVFHFSQEEDQNFHYSLQGPWRPQPPRPAIAQSLHNLPIPSFTSSNMPGSLPLCSVLVLLPEVSHHTTTLASAAFPTSLTST